VERYYEPPNGLPGEVSDVLINADSYAWFAIEASGIQVASPARDGGTNRRARSRLPWLAVLGVGGRIAKKLPPDAATLTILRSDQLSTAQDVADTVRPLAIGLTALALILFAIAVYLARGWRREALRATGFALLLAGVAALVARSIVGHAVVESLTTTESTKSAVEDAWSIGTSLLDQAAVAAVAYGLVILFAAWLSGPSRMAESTRAALAPYLRDPMYAWGGTALIVLLLLIWGPTPATRQAFTALLLIGLLIFGVEMLRRQTLREFPDASLEAASARRQERLSGLVGRMRGPDKS